MTQLENLSSWLMPQKPTAWHIEPEYLSYLQDLSSYSLSQIQEEPERLRQEHAQLDIDTQSLAYQNYRTFILTADCSSGILAHFEDVSTHLDVVVDRATSVKSACSQFLQRSAEVEEQRKNNSLVLSKHAELLEVLEIPQVMETCVRNCYYEEALELSHHVQRLSKRLNHIRIMQGIAHDVSNTMELMQTQLLQQLGTSIQLPACLKTIGYLRRMGVFEEGELRIKFLQTRDSWLQKTLSAIPSEDAYSYLGKLIETSRVHLFDVITQYRAIFPNDDPLAVMTSSNSSPEDKRSYAYVFYGWISCKVGDFLRSLDSVLSTKSVQRLDSLLSQSMYFGLSFSRIGADFRPILGTIFHRALFRSLSVRISAASIEFGEAIKDYVLTPPYSHTSSGHPQPSRDTSNASAALLSPPHSLVQFTPLARYLNQILTVLNEVKQCPIVSLAVPLRSSLETSVSQLVLAVCAFDARERSSYTQKEKELFLQLCSVTRNDLIPFINSALLHLFPLDNVNEVLSRTPCVLSSAGRAIPGDSIQVGKKIDIYIPLNCAQLSAPLAQLYPEEMARLARETARSEAALQLTSQPAITESQGDIKSGNSDEIESLSSPTSSPTQPNDDSNQ